LSLADDSCNKFESNVNILVGLDYYHSFFSGRIIRADKGPVALESVLGWVLSGSIGH